MKREREAALPSHLPYSFSLKLFSYIPLPSSAYHKARELLNNLYQILQATPRNGGCGSSAFPACETTPQRTTFPNIFQP